MKVNHTFKKSVKGELLLSLFKKRLKRLKEWIHNPAINIHKKANNIDLKYLGQGGRETKFPLTINPNIVGGACQWL